MEYGSLIERVLVDITSTPNKTFSSVDYNPPRSCHVALVCNKEPEQAFIDKIQNLDYIESIEVIPPFLNLSFNNKLVKLFKQKTPNNNMSASVEHTSTVAVYPLNLAVFRSSVIGEWIRRALVYLGFKAKGRIWVQDSARQVALVNFALQSECRIAKKTGFGKGDHTIGRIFAESILQMVGGDELSTKKVKNIAAELFPFGYSGVRRPCNSDWINDVLLGWQTTFNLAGIYIDHFDRDQSFVKDGWESTINSARKIHINPSFLTLSSGNINEKNLTYIERSILYYCYLLKQSHISFSVVPYRQLEKQQFAKRIACAVEGRDGTDLTIIPFGDTKVESKFDSIKGYRFTTVDSFSKISDVSISTLLEKYLTTRASSNLNILFPICPIESYVGVQKVTSCEPVPKAILLLDELPILLKQSLTMGDFAKIIQWTAKAIIIEEQIKNDFASIAKTMSSAIELFSPFSSNQRS